MTMAIGARAKIAPGPRGNFLLGNLKEFRRDALALLTESARRYGDVVRCRLGRYIVHLVNHPAHAAYVLCENAQNYDKHTRSASKINAACGNGLLSSNGELWRRQRRLMQPAFHSDRVQRLASVVTEATDTMLQRRWADHSRSGQPLDVAAEVKRLTCCIAARAFFGSAVDNDAAAIEGALEVLLETTWSRLQSVLDLSRFFPTARKRRFREAIETLDRIVYRIIAERRQSTNGPMDLLSMLLASRDVQTGESMEDRQLRDETITMLLAGHETTANALVRTLYLISKFPVVESRLRAELAEVLNGRLPHMDDVPKLQYTTGLFQESLRLYPPIWIIERRAIRQDEIGGYTIPAGSSVVISPFALHRHPAFWENPEGFDPERFLPARLAALPRYAYLPFGIGTHQCIGKDFAMIEAILVVATVTQRYHLQLVPGHPFLLRPGITLGLRHGVLMTIHRSAGPGDKL